MVDHHAVLYRVHTLDDASSLIALLAREADVQVFDYPVLKIAEVRQIIQVALERPRTKTRQYLVIKTNQIPVEAQNALLKILEEPPVTTRFVLLVKSNVTLLPTVLSRVVSAELPSTQIELPGEIVDFLEASIPDRLATLAAAAKRKDDAWFNALQDGLYQFASTATDSQLRADLLPTLTYLPMRGSSKKMLWEDLAFRLPVAQ